MELETPRASEATASPAAPQLQLTESSGDWAPVATAAKRLDVPRTTLRHWIKIEVIPKDAVRPAKPRGQEIDLERARPAIDAWRSKPYHHSEETKRKIGENQPHRKYDGETRTCRQCGEEFWARPWDIANGLDPRWCSKSCRMRWLREHEPETWARELSVDHDRAQAARLTQIEQAKAEHGLITLGELLDRLPLKIKPSPSAVCGDVRKGRLTSANDEVLEGPAWGTDPLLFRGSVVEEYAALLDEYPDGRRRRFYETDEEHARFRAGWYQELHDSTAEWGRLAPLLADPDDPPGPKRKVNAEQIEDIYRRADGLGPNRLRRSIRAIAEDLGIPPGRVRRVLDARKSLCRNPPNAVP